MLHENRLHDVVSRISVGGTAGCLVFLVEEIAAYYLWNFDLWHYSEWSTAVGLPVAFFLGAVAGLTLRRSAEFKLTGLEIVLCYWILWLDATVMTPSVSRVQGEKRELWETIPWAIAIAFGVLAWAKGGVPKS
jgi:hypothetical protein